MASLSQTTNLGNLASFTTGADALLITKTVSGAQTLQKIAKSVPDIPWGLWLGDISRKVVKPVAEAGGDFVVFPASSALSIPDDEKTGKLLQIETSLSDGLLRAVNELPVDAVLTVDEAGGVPSLTWYHLMLFQRIAGLLTKPLLVPISLAISANELEVLWKAGVDGVVLEVGTSLPPGRFKELRQTIDKLTFPSRQRRKMEALLPRLAEGTGTVTETEEEEGDE
jgi:hypothetical protein